MQVGHWPGLCRSGTFSRNFLSLLPALLEQNVSVDGNSEKPDPAPSKGEATGGGGGGGCLLPETHAAFVLLLSAPPMGPPAVQGL